MEHPGRGGAVTASDLLARTALYKVGHHRSHNATLRARGLKLMTRDDLMAMIPVDHEMAARQDWAMPLPGLLHRLEEKTKGRVLRADEGLPAHRPDTLDQRRWDQFLARTAVEERWIDHTLTW